MKKFQLNADFPAELTQTRFFEAVLAAMPDYVYAFNRDHRFAYVNQVMQGLFGENIRLIGKNFEDLDYPVELAQKLHGYIEQVFITGETAEDEVFYTSPTGVSAYFNFSWGPVFNDSGEVELVVGISRDMTERRELEERIRESEARWRGLIETLAQSTWETDPDGYVVKDSPSWRAYTGQTLSEWLGEGWVNAIHPSQRTPALQQWKEVLKMGKDLDAELSLYHAATQTYRWTNVRATRVFDEKGNVVKWVGMNIDIEDRKRTEEARLESEDRFRSFVDTTTDVVYRMSPDWREMYLLNGRGFLKDVTHPDNTWIDVYIPLDEQAVVKNTINNAIKYKHMFELEHRVKRSDGYVGWLQSRAVPLLDKNGAIKEWLGASTDITHRRNVQEALQNFNVQLEQEVATRTIELQENKDLLQVTLNSSSDMIQVFRAVRDKDGKIIDFVWVLNNQAAEEIYGDVIGQSLLQNNPGVVEQGIFDNFVKVTETGASLQYEKHYVHEQFNGWFYQSVIKLNDGVATCTRDITERKEVELALQKSHDQLQSIFNTTLLQMSILQAIRNEDGEIDDFLITLVNKELEKETGRNDLVGKRYLHEYPGVKEAGLFGLIVKTVETGEPQSTEYYYPYEGFNKWFSCMFVKLNDGVVATNLDISAGKLAEEKVRQLESEQQLEIFRATLTTQEEERGRISESLHNGLGQLLYGIKLSLDNVAEEEATTDPEKFRGDLKYTQSLLSDAISETRRISHELMPAILEEFGLKAALKDVCDQLQKAVKISLSLKGFNNRLDKYLELAIFRTVQELLINVVKHAEAAEARAELTAANKGINIRVSDNGKGIQADKKGRPGIGLASIRNKVKLLNGNVKVLSGPAKGTTIEVEIPWANG
ncbi:PAS domain-containing protein [Mucilaginibacter sp. RS28]|uniref:Oxygen sensor histidine kinase NreB n=1 Tax=Mucilaginibacter straminoryzae TaxID=2932774 RepID=A0A9X1X783_9SPHI|nr:PAS domain-containing protein [Mucilaginibacter straminoryzae]MCJ8210973.1 PAS domain-containing protein [Mucilaginibacter straminoryzae]